MIFGAFLLLVAVAGSAAVIMLVGMAIAIAVTGGWNGPRGKVDEQDDTL